MKSAYAEVKPLFPMRINKYLAHKGHATRRGVDMLIAAGKVFINGHRAVLGDKVLEHDVVEVRGAKPKSYVYVAYNKPEGIITHSAEEGEEDIKGMLAGVPGAAGLFPVGRLDKDSHGLIILTNDGRITDRLLNPDRMHEKEYVVKTKEHLRGGFAARMSSGIDIGDYVTKPCRVVRTGDFSFRITLEEGKKHQIRRMVDAMKNEVADLKRVRIMNIELKKLAPGNLRKIEGEELKTFLASLGM